MKGWTDTSLAIANMTDEGLFESLATDVLRQAVPAYARLAHVGTNAAGKTRKAPVDALGFEHGAASPHLVVVHHTISAAGGLGQKWLRDPAKVKKRKANSPDPPAGDVIKSIQVIATERLRRPGLRATLVLTTNSEPDEAVVLEVEALCAENQVEVDIWTRTRITNVLDNTAPGQWIRRKYLGTPQRYLSEERFRELSLESLEVLRPVDTAEAWISRELDTELAAIRRPVTFLASRSGSGKTVACYRLACNHINAGGLALVISAETVNDAPTLDHALEVEISRLDPALELSESATQWSQPGQPLLLIVEDINRSGQPVRLMEKITRWGLKAEAAKAPSNWRLICPTWPQVIDAADHSLTKAVERMVQVAGALTPPEGQAAVMLRAEAQGEELSLVEASGISEELGHDPLLIALYDFKEKPTPRAVIGRYVHRELHMLAHSSDTVPAEYLTALRAMSLRLMEKLQIEPPTSQLLNQCEDARQEALIRALIAKGTVIYRQAGPELDPVLRFRHDRVRDWLFVDALTDADEHQPLQASAIEDPFLAEIVGDVIAERDFPDHLLLAASSAAPLALFHAMRSLPPSKAGAGRARLLATIDTWLGQLPVNEGGSDSLLWECVSALARTDDPIVPSLIEKIPYDHPTGLSAALRNGDVRAGAMLCAMFEPGMNMSVRDAQISHAQHVIGDALLESVRALLIETKGQHRLISGLLRLAGHIGHPSLGGALLAKWESDPHRAEYLADYLWAFARCCDESNARSYLQPILDMWESLPNEPDDYGSSKRSRLATYNVDWAFARTPPVNAIPYFIERAESPDLRWPILFMLRNVYDERVLDVLREELAARHRIDGDRAFWFRNSIFGFGDRDKPLPALYRTRLAELWRADAEDHAARLAAFELWSIGLSFQDLKILIDAKVEPEWEERVLQKRLLCGDRDAMDALIVRLDSSCGSNAWWWQYAGYVPGDKILDCIDRTLARRRDHAKDAADSDLDWQIAPVLMRYSPEHIERILVEHWDHVSTSHRFIQAALFAATPKTIQLAASAIQALPEPGEAFKMISMGFGIWQQDGVSVSRRAQIESLAPYIALIPEHDLLSLAGHCDSLGWADTRDLVFGDVLKTIPSRWSSGRSAQILDDMSSREHCWVRNEVDQILKTGVTWPDLLSDLKRWLETRQTISALSFVSEAIEYKGTRVDLAVLDVFTDASNEEVRRIVAETSFSVRRRVA